MIWLRSKIKRVHYCQVHFRWYWRWVTLSRPLKNTIRTQSMHYHKSRKLSPEALYLNILINLELEPFWTFCAVLWSASLNQNQDIFKSQPFLARSFQDAWSFFVFAYGAINDPCVFAIFADWRQVALEIDACRTDVTSLGWGGVGMLTFMLTCVTCTTDVTSLGWGGVGMLTFMLTCVTCTTDVTSLGWGGVGMLTFMLTCVTCTTDVTSLGWGGVGMLKFMLTCVTCTTDVTSLGWGGVGMLTFMLTCVTCTTDVTSLGWGGVGMLTFMLTCVTCTTDVTSLGWGGGGDVNVHVNLRHMHNWRHVTGLGWGGDVNVHVEGTGKAGQKESTLKTLQGKLKKKCCSMTGGQM